jgi:5'(3')-deoxyribonucleotidase
MRIRRILLDMDCVLADFLGGYARLLNIPVGLLLAHWELGEYPAEHTRASLGKLRGRPISEEEFWRPINSNPGFWFTLPRLPWADDLVGMVKASGREWYVVSAPSRCPTCIAEKEKWLEHHFGLPHDRLIPTKHKHTMAKPGVLLIDDSLHNTDAFVREGGRAILFPAHHNPMHVVKDDPMSHVTPLLKEMLV